MHRETLLQLLDPADRDRMRHGCVVTVGNFDGLHRGHRSILRDVRARAARLGVPAVALTFEPHPVGFFRRTPPSTFRLSTSEQRAWLLHDAGVDVVVTAPFDDALASVSAEAFVDEGLAGALAAREVHIGHDFRFGAGRRGDAALLEAHGRTLGFDVVRHEACTLDGAPVSSSRVREAVRAGDAPEVARLLERSWTFCGTVEHGDGRGRSIAVPTINLYPDGLLLPPFGVWASRLLFDGAWHDAITNIGLRPTFGTFDRPSVETLVLGGFDRAAWDMPIAVELVRALRPELRFEDAAALRARIAIDIADARTALAAAPGPHGPVPGLATDAAALPHHRAPPSG